MLAWPYNFLNYLGYSSELEKEELSRSIEYILTHSFLSDKQITVIRIRYEQNMTLREIGEIINLSVEPVRIIILQAKMKIRQRSMNKDILAIGITEYQKNVHGPVTLGDLNLSPMLVMRLEIHGYTTIEQILQLDSREELLKIPTFGKARFDKLISAIEKEGFNCDHLKE